MNFATVHETCNWGGPHGEEEQGNRGGKARGPALFPKLVEPRQWNRALRFQFDMCIVIEDAKAPSHCPPGLVTSHGIINCLGVCIYIYVLLWVSRGSVALFCCVPDPRHLCFHSCNWRTEGDFFPPRLWICSFSSVADFWINGNVLFILVALYLCKFKYPEGRVLIKIEKFWFFKFQEGRNCEKRTSFLRNKKTLDRIVLSSSPLKKWANIFHFPKGWYADPFVFSSHPFLK